MGTDDPKDKQRPGLGEAATMPAFDPVSSGEASDATDETLTAEAAAAMAETKAGPAPAAGTKPATATSASGGLASASGASSGLPPTLEAGAKIGRFSVIEKLGEGGMGVVVAAHDPLLDRKVALKLMRPQASGTGRAGRARQRLLREAQAMAKLSHPNLIPVFDAAEIGDQVCIAMELVQGGTLGAWVRAEKRPWRDILAVYISAGRGLAAAHEAGLIHRDFKPDNVLIDDKLRVRVTDFGLVAAVASAMNDTGQDRSVEPNGPVLDESASALAMSLTTTGDVMGTPNYMAPEQHRGGVTDARTDQFGFCVALYEALYGERPFTGLTYKQVSESVIEGDISDPPPDVYVPAWVRAILLRGLANARADRFPTMDALLDALERDPAAIRRRRLEVAGAAALIVALAGTLLFVVARGRAGGSAPCAGADSALTGVWDDQVTASVKKAFLATGQAYASHTYTSVAETLDDYSAAWVAMRTEACEATRVHGKQSDAMLDRRMNCLDRRLAELRALTTLFATTTDRELLDRAVGAAGAAVPLHACADTRALAAAVPPPEDPELRKRVDLQRGRLAEARAHRIAGNYRKGRKIAEEVTEQAREIAHSPLLADALYMLGILQYRGQDAKAAEATLREAGQEAARARNDDLAAKTWITLMMALSTGQGRPDEAMKVSAFAEAALARAGDKPLERADFLRELGNVLVAQGKYAEGHDLHRQALALVETSYPADHLALASYYNDIGASLTYMGKYAEALAQFERVLAIETKSFGDEHPMIALSLHNLAIVHGATGKPDRALELERRALAISEKVHGPDHPIVADALIRVGRRLVQQDNRSDALRLYQRAVAILERERGRAEPKLVRAREQLAYALWLSDDLDGAREQYEQALAAAERAYGSDHDTVVRLLDALGDVAREHKAFDRALEHHQRALAIRQTKLGPEHAEVATSLFKIGAVHWSAGKLDEALALHEKGLAIEVKALGPVHSDIARSLNSIGELLRAQGKLAQARDHYQRSLAMHTLTSGPEHASLASPLNNLGEVACARKQFAEALEYCSRGLALEEKERGPEHPNLAYYLTCLGRAELGLRRPEQASELLQRALDLRDGAQVDAHELAATRFAMARALWASGGDRERALDLARRAREALDATTLAPPGAQAEVETWLRKRRQR